MASTSSQREGSHGPLRSEFSSAVRRGHVGRSKRSSTFPAWLLLTGILLIPSSLAVHLAEGGFKFTPGRAAITLLLVPALFQLRRGARHFVISDLFVFLTSAWMIGSRLQEDGLHGSAVAEVIELLGGYIVSRAFFFGRPALQDFLHVFQIMTVTLIILACLEPFAGRNVVTAITSMLFHTPEFYPQYRAGIVRAQSTLEDAEHFGTFCCVAGSLFLYSQPTGVRKLLWVGFCFFGCLLALSSGPLLVFAIVIGSHFYDVTLKRFSWRWKAYVTAMAVLVAIPYIFAKHPTAWLIEHLTLDPSTGYFRLYVFDYAFDQIALNPLTGVGFGQVGNDEFLGRTTIRFRLARYCPAFRYSHDRLFVINQYRNLFRFWAASQRERNGPLHQCFGYGIHFRHNVLRIYRANGPFLERDMDAVGRIAWHAGLDQKISNQYRKSSASSQPSF